MGKKIDVSIETYNEMDGLRVSDIVSFATKDINSIIKELNTPKEYTDQIILGLVAHSLILRKDKKIDFDNLPSDIVVIDSSSYRTKEAKEAKEKAIFDGKTPILYKTLHSLVDSIHKAEPFLDKFFDSKLCEFEVAYTDRDDVFGDIRGRVDAIYNNECIHDLKVSTNTINIDKKIFDSGYQLQMFIYMNLTGLKEAKIIFFNPETSLISVKSLHYNLIKDECHSLIKRAVDNMRIVRDFNNRDVGILDCGEYQTPQWALTYLLES